MVNKLHLIKFTVFLFILFQPQAPAQEWDWDYGRPMLVVRSRAPIIIVPNDCSPILAKAIELTKPVSPSLANDLIHVHNLLNEVIRGDYGKTTKMLINKLGYNFKWTEVQRYIRSLNNAYFPNGICAYKKNNYTLLHFKTFSDIVFHIKKKIKLGQLGHLMIQH